MNKEEYIIVNKTTLEKRIEDLSQISALHRLCYDGMIECEERILKEILSQSTPLIPEIEKSIDIGYKFARQNLYKADNTLQPKVQNYISNLKLDT